MPRFWVDCADIHILFSHAPTVIPISSCYQNTFVLQSTSLIWPFYQFSKGRMALNNIRRVQGYVQLLADLGDSLGLVLAAAVGEKNERDTLLFQES